MNSTDSQNKIEKVFSEVLQTKNINFHNDIDLASLPGLNSMKFVKIILELEKAFGIKFEPRQVVGLKRYSDLAQLLEEKTKKN
jgi:acyl carrier protein